jgi:hypothetical protein
MVAFLTNEQSAPFRLDRQGLGPFLPLESEQETIKLADQLGTLYWKIALQEPNFGLVVATFRDSVSIEPTQCDVSISWILVLRQATETARDSLVNLDQEHTHLLCAQASITELTELSEQLSEVLLSLALFGQMCQQIMIERIDFHLLLRHLLCTSYVVLQDTLSQLAALAEMAMFFPEKAGGQQ